jgi:hypothetical protein
MDKLKHIKHEYCKKQCPNCLIWNNNAEAVEKMPEIDKKNHPLKMCDAMKNILNNRKEFDEFLDRIR